MLLSSGVNSPALSVCEITDVNVPLIFSLPPLGAHSEFHALLYEFSRKLSQMVV